MSTHNVLSNLPAPPEPAVELLEVLRLRQRLLRSVSLGVVGVGVLATLLMPGLIPSRPLVGAAIGVAACLLAVAAAVAADAGDEVVRGPRHVRAAGGKVSLVVPASDRSAAVEAVADMLSGRAGDGTRLRVAVTPVSGSIGGWVDALAMAVAARGPRTVLADLTLAGDPGRDGVAEVAAGDARLADSVRFDESLMLARIGPGSERALGLRALPGFVARMPKDVEVLLVALPGIRHPGVSTALGAVPDAVLLVTAGSTSRVDLMAALETIAASGGRSDIVLRDEGARMGDGGRGGDSRGDAGSGIRIVSGQQPDAARRSEPGSPRRDGDRGGDLRGDGRDADAAPRDREEMTGGPATAPRPEPDRQQHARDDTDAQQPVTPDPADDPRSGRPDGPSARPADGADTGRVQRLESLALSDGGDAPAPSLHDDGTDDLLRVEAALQALSEQVWQIEERGPA